MIRGYFDESKQPPLPKCRVGVFIPGITDDWVFIEFIVDTGASTTCIHPIDAIGRLDIDPQALADEHTWLHPEPYGGSGGHASTYFRLPATYLFPAEHGQWVKHVGSTRLAQLKPFNQKIDSLLGWDMLRHFRLVTDWSRRAVELHPTP